MLFLLKDFPQKLKLEKFHGILIIPSFCKSGFSLATKNLLSLLKTQPKVTTLQQVSSGNTLSFVLKRMVGHFLKIQPVKEKLGFQD